MNCNGSRPERLGSLRVKQALVTTFLNMSHSISTRLSLVRDRLISSRFALLGAAYSKA